MLGLHAAMIVDQATRPEQSRVIQKMQIVVLLVVQQHRGVAMAHLGALGLLEHGVIATRHVAMGCDLERWLAHQE